MTSGMDITYKDLEKGELRLPVYRSLYLDRMLENFKEASVTKNEAYQDLIHKIEDKEFGEECKLPKNLNTELRNYQKTGYEWLKVLNNYGFGGILADDMGLGKTVQLISL